MPHSRSWTASAGSVQEEAGDRGDHILLAQGRGGPQHARDQADERLGQASAGDVVANVPAGLTALEQLAQRPGDAALEALGVGSDPLAGQQHERVPDVDQGAYGASDAFIRSHLVDPRRSQPPSASPTAAWASSSNRACRLGK